MQAGSRPAAVAGSFYPSDGRALLDEIDRCFADNSIGPGESLRSRNVEEQVIHPERTEAVECFVVPHAGYSYSGPVAAHGFSRIRRIFAGGRFTAIILGPNHYGIGSGIALSPSSEWETPLGPVKVNREASEAIRENSGMIDVDGLAHSREHSIEVQLPFIRATAGEASIVPICLMLQDKESAKEVANSIYEFLRSEGARGGSFLVLGSSDLTHYEPLARAAEQDMKLVRKIEALDVDSFYTTLERNNVTACGYGAIAVSMLVAKKLGKKRGNLLKYATSGDVTAERGSVVGYCSVHFT